MMNISNKGIALLKQFEGLHDGNKATPILEPEKDPIGLYTLGWGARYDKNGVVVTKSTPGITLDEADQLLRRDIMIAERCIAKHIKTGLTQNQFDALCSIIFNIGIGGFQKSRLLKAVNLHTVNETHFTAWSKVRKNGVLVPHPGLLARRKAEYKVFIS